MSTARLLRQRWLCLVLLALAVMAVLGHVCALLPAAEAQATFPATTHGNHHEDLHVVSCDAAVSSSAQAAADAADGGAVDALAGEPHGASVSAATRVTARRSETASLAGRAALFLLHQVFLI